MAAKEKVKRTSIVLAGETVRLFKVGKLLFGAASPERAASLIARHVVDASVQPVHLHLANAYSIALADRDDSLAKAFNDGGFSFPDGKPVSWVSRLRRDDQSLEQVRGPAFFENVIGIGREHGVRHYLLGSSEENLELIKIAVQRKFPGAVIAGTHSPPFRALTAEEIRDQDNRIVETEPHIVWVGLGTPKQDLEAARLVAATGVTSIAIGAAFDFTAGTLRAAPEWVGKIGLEWLFRLLTEPRRLWRRYLFGNARFIAAAVKGWRG